MADPRKQRSDASKELSEAAVGALRRFMREIPAAARDWPKQAWDTIRMPADLILGGSPEEKMLARQWEGSGMVPLPANPILQARGPERRARQVAEFANPVLNAAFAPKQTLALASSPAGQATLGGLAAMLTGVGDIAPAAAMAGVIKPKVGSVDPLAQVIAARMIGQLNAVADLPGMKSLQKVNLPAAYAGDARSMQAVRRAINEAETGLESPSRRNMMKQSAALTARQAVPDAIMNAVGTGVIRKALTDEIADTPKVTSLLDDMFNEYGYSEHIPSDLRDLAAMFNMPDEVYSALRESNTHGFGGLGSGGNFVNEYELQQLLDDVIPGFTEGELSKIPLEDAKKYMEAYELDKPLREIDWAKYKTQVKGPEEFARGGLARYKECNCGR